jgi:hypothetical protein
MKIKIGNFALALALCGTFFLLLPTTSSAQDVFNPDFNQPGNNGGGGGCNWCELDYCGCATTAWAGAQVLTGWDCTCSDNYCERDCNYSPR